VTQTDLQRRPAPRPDSEVPQRNQTAALLIASFGGSPIAWDLVLKFRTCSVPDPEYVDRLIAVGRGQTRAAWEVRCLACLLLEAWILKPSGSRRSQIRLLETLGLMSKTEGRPVIVADVLKMGFRSMRPDEFLQELCARLNRNAPLHAALSGSRLAGSDVRKVVRICGQESRLFFARFMFTPEEVLSRIRGQVRISVGEINHSVMHDQTVRAEIRAALASLPQYERDIVERLSTGQRIWWVAPETKARVHGLVEYPRGTVVLVVKPPGSDLEVEIKRAGLRGPWPLTIVFARRGREVPPPHRLWGGSMLYFLRWEAVMGARLSKLHRSATDLAAPISRTVHVNNIRQIPVGSGEVKITDYLSRSAYFGAGFRVMRRNLKRAITAFGKEREWYGETRPGPRGTTLEFLDIVAPGQSILLGSSSFRLEQLTRDLAPDGAESYATEALGADAGPNEGRAFADDLLDEIFDRYAPPGVRYCDHRQYLEAVFDEPSNRAAANRSFVSLMRQIGAFWAVFLATRSHSRGETFTPRNVGIRKCWNDGRWQIRICFMDNDDLQLVGKSLRFFWPLSALPGINMDRAHLLGGQIVTRVVKGSVDCLEEIYRVDAAHRAEGLRALFVALRARYHQSLAAMRTRSEMHDFFTPTFVDTIGDWDEVMGWYYRHGATPGAQGGWEREVRDFLSRRDYPDRLVDQYVRAPAKIPLFTEIFRQIIAPDSSP
jgi:hypothetical protein